MKNRKLLPIIVAAIALAAAASVHPAYAAGLLYINPPQQGPFASGTSVTYQVKVANIDPFSGWDIQVQTDPAAVNPSSFTITPNLLVANFSGSGFELIHCVNGVGTMCTLTDGPGIVHSAFQLLSLPPQLGPSSGLLFTITYTAGTGTFSAVHFLSEVISNGTPIPVAVTVQDGLYGKRATTTTVTCTPPTVTVGQPFSCTATVTDNSPGTLSAPGGTVTFTATGVSFSSSTASCTLSPGATAGTATCSGNFTPSSSGTASISAAYMPTDGTHNGSTSAIPATVVVTISDLPPIASFTVTPGNNSLAGTIQTFDASASHDQEVGGSVTSFFWTFGDGMSSTNSSASKIVTHSYANGGSFTVTLQVTDNGGLHGTKSALLIVLPVDCHFVHGKLSWTHHLSLAKNPAGQTFTAHIRCDTTGPEFVQVSVQGMNGVGASYSATSATTLLQPGVVTDVTFSGAVASSFVGTKVCFTAKVNWGPTAATVMTNLSPVTKSGCFAVVP